MANVTSLKVDLKKVCVTSLRGIKPLLIAFLAFDCSLSASLLEKEPSLSVDFSFKLSVFVIAIFSYLLAVKPLEEFTGKIIIWLTPRFYHSMNEIQL